MEAAEYDRLAAVEEQHWYFHALNGRAIDALTRAQVPARAHVLDAGCGTGGMLRSLAQWRPDLQVHGLDFSPLACTRAQDRGFEVTQGSIEELPFPDESFHAITSLDVLPQIESPLLALLEFFRCLRPGGVVVLNAAAYPWLWSYHDERCQSVQRYRRSQLRRLLREAGLTEVFSTYWNTTMFPLFVLRRKVFTRSPDGGSDVQPVSWPVNVACGLIAGAERRLNHWRVPLPYGSSVFIVARKSTAKPRVKLE